MSKVDIAAIRRDYTLRSLTESEVAPDPFDQFQQWFREVIAAQVDEPNAMTLATSTLDGKPSARIVLLKGFDSGGFYFFTNYESRKARDIDQNPRGALVFFWKELERQVRVEGGIEKIPPMESDEYFNSRPEASRIGAWASPQSRVVRDRNYLDEQYARVEREFRGEEVERPSFWGGYVLKPGLFEFWQGRPGRLHDRIQYSRRGDAWAIERLAP